MNRFAVVAVALLVTLSLAASSSAQSAGGAKVAVANPARIFNEIQETKDLKQKMENEVKNLQALRQTREGEIRQARELRDQLKPESPQWQDRNKELLQKTIEFRAWVEITEQNLQRMQKQQMKNVYDKIVATVAELAQQRGIELVISEQRADINIDNVDINQLKGLIAQQNVLYNAATIDLSNDTIAAMDAKYKSGK